jgi:MFS family permease
VTAIGIAVGASRFGGLPRPFWWLWAGHVVNRLGTVVEPYLALYLAARGLHPAAIGGLLAVYGVGSLLSQPLGGWLADRFGVRRSLVASLVAAAASLAVLGAARDPALLWPACLLAGVGVDLCRPIILAAAATLTGRHDRARAQSLMFWGSSVGFAAGCLGAGALASAGYGWLFVLDAVTCAVFAVLVWVRVPELSRAGAPSARGWGHVLADRVCLAFVSLQLIAAIAIFQLGTIGALTLHGAGVTPVLYGVILAATAAAVAVGQPLANPWLLERDPPNALAGAAALTASGCALAALAATPLELVPAIAALAAGQVVTFAVSPGVIASLGVRQPGRYQGLAGGAYSLAFLIAPLLGGVLLAAASASAAWLCSAALCVVVAFGQRALAPALRARLV